MNKVLVLLGPTGVGKTGASLLLAQKLGTEIISADSMQIYRHMDIGTAKPSPEELSLVKHHMIDIVDPSEEYSTGRYIDAVVPILDSLHRAGKIPLVVGGTGLYIRAMTRGIFTGPSADWRLRHELLSREERDRGSLYRCLMERDPAAASRIKPTDLRRIVRAIEVCMKTDDNISALQKTLTKPLPYDFIQVGLTRNRRELYPMIEQRVDAMLSRGLVDEVQRLIAMSPSKTALQAIGYKEIARFLEGVLPFDEAVRIIKKRSKAYAKRQYTWFRREDGIQWLDVTGRSDHPAVVDAIAIFLQNRLT